MQTSVDLDAKNVNWQHCQTAGKQSQWKGLLRGEGTNGQIQRESCMCMCVKGTNLKRG